MIGKGLSEKGTFEQRSEENEGSDRGVQTCAKALWQHRVESVLGTVRSHQI